MCGVRRLCTKSRNSTLLCATSVSSVSLWCTFAGDPSTTETQRTQRLHREISSQCLLCKAEKYRSVIFNQLPRYEFEEMFAFYLRADLRDEDAFRKQFANCCGREVNAVCASHP